MAPPDRARSQNIIVSDRPVDDDLAEFHRCGLYRLYLAVEPPQSTTQSPSSYPDVAVAINTNAGIVGDEDGRKQFVTAQ